MKSPRTVVSMLVALTLVALVSGCSKKSTPLGLEALDEAPPAAPTQLVQVPEDGSGSSFLQWAPSSSANVAGYEVYRYDASLQPADPYVLAAETGASTTRYQLPAYPQMTDLYYRLRAVSATGVKSEWSAMAMVTVGPGPSGPGDNTGPVGTIVPVRH